ncbi:transposase [Rhodococcus globerulus]|uniref:transposase n=1 Tax=Rhodococcus globerulus TaxID=33008 RepID=UPI00374FCAE8
MRSSSTSQPGLGPVLAARVLGEFGDDTTRFSKSRARKNYSGQSPVTRPSGKRTLVITRYATNRRLGMPCISKRSAQSRHHPVHGHTTTKSEAEVSVIIRPSGNSPTGSSVFSMAA